MRYTLIIISVLPLLNSQFLGPSDITVHRVEKCGEFALGFNLNYTWRKINRYQSVATVWVDMPFDFDDRITLNMTAHRWGDGGWKPNAVNVFEKNPCLFAMKHFKEDLKIHSKALNIPLECPVKKFNRTWTDYPVNIETISPLMYGEYKGEGILSRDGIVFACGRVFGKIEPKKMFGK